MPSAPPTTAPTGPPDALPLAAPAGFPGYRSGYWVVVAQMAHRLANAVTIGVARHTVIPRHHHARRGRRQSGGDRKNRGTSHRYLRNVHNALGAVIRSKRCRIEARSTRVACRAGETRHRAPNAARSSLLHGEFGTYHEWADLDCSRRTGVPPSLMLKADVVLLSKIFRGHVTLIHSR